MKTGALIISLVVIFLVGFFIAYYIQGSKISELSDSIENYKNEANEYQTLSNKYLDLLKSGQQTCLINPPFACNAFDIKNDKISIEVTNAGGQDFSGVTLSIENCGETDTNSIKTGETATFEIPCTTRKPYIYKEISINYEGKIAEGYIYSAVD